MERQFAECVFLITDDEIKKAIEKMTMPELRVKYNLNNDDQLRLRFVEAIAELITGCKKTDFLYAEKHK